MFFINNTLRDKVYRNNLMHGFWDNRRTYQEFIENLYGEFDVSLKDTVYNVLREIYKK